MAKTPEQEAIYLAGRCDAQVLCNLFFAGRPIQAPILTGDEAPVCRCGGMMSRNPHPDAGKPSAILEVGAMWECIPCAAAARHNWAERALAAEKKLNTKGP